MKLDVVALASVESSAPSVAVSEAPIVLDPPAVVGNDVARSPSEAVAEFIVANPEANRTAAAKRFGISKTSMDAIVRSLRREGRLSDLRCVPRANEPGPGEVTLQGAAQIVKRSPFTLTKIYIRQGRLTPARDGDRGTHFYSIADCERLRDELAAEDAERKRLKAEKALKEETEARARKERLRDRKRSGVAFGGNRPASPTHFEDPSPEILDPVGDGVRLDPSIKSPIKIRTIVDPIERPKNRWAGKVFSPRARTPDPQRDRERAEALARLDPSKIVRLPPATDRCERYERAVERNEAFRIEREALESPADRQRRRERHEAVVAERALDLSVEEVIGKGRGPLSNEELRLRARAKARARLKAFAKAHARALLRLAGREHELDQRWWRREMEDDLDDTDESGPGTNDGQI